MEVEVVDETALGRAQSFWDSEQLLLQGDGSGGGGRKHSVRESPTDHRNMSASTPVRPRVPIIVQIVPRGTVAVGVRVLVHDLVSDAEGGQSLKLVCWLKASKYRANMVRRCHFVLGRMCTRKCDRDSRSRGRVRTRRCRFAGCPKQKGGFRSR